MSIWYPGSGLTYGQYLQTNSFIRDIKGQIKTVGKAIETKVSDQTLQLVANNRELSHQFKTGFDSMNNTLEWGFDRIEYALQDVTASIDSLHTDFNYGMGLLLEQVQIQNNLLIDLIDKLDAIYEILQSPTRTQAREFYYIGCERLKKGLLDKALEALLDSEKKNDTDFFTQFLIGKLYLYGVDEDDNVIDLEKAKQHLLLAARYAKAEILVDASFTKLAAEALVHASIAIYARLGDKGVAGNKSKTTELLQEAERVAKEATKLEPNLIEANYHLAKYYALLNQSTNAINNLEKAIVTDHNYAIKVDIDHAFDPIRSYVINLLIKLRKQKMIESEAKIIQAEKLIKQLETWHIEDSELLRTEFLECKQNLSNAETLYDNQTYFGFLGSIPFADNVITRTQKLNSERIKELKIEITGILKAAKQNFPNPGYYSKQVDEWIIDFNKLETTAMSHLTIITYESFMKALLIAKEAQQKAININTYTYNEDKERSQKEIKERERKERLKREESEREEQFQREESERKKLLNEFIENIKTYSAIGIILGVIAGFIGGCVRCSSVPDDVVWEIFPKFFGALFIGIIAGPLIGFFIAVLEYFIKSSSIGSK